MQLSNLNYRAPAKGAKDNTVTEYTANKQLTPPPQRSDYATYTEYLTAYQQWSMHQ